MPTKRRSQPPRRPTKKTPSSAPPKRATAAKPARPAKAIKSVKSAKSAKPAKPAKPAKKVKPARPVKSARHATARRGPGGKPAGKTAAPRKAPPTPARQSGTKPHPGKPAAGRGRRATGSAAASAGPTSHDQAVETFERGFQALQLRQFGKAATLLTAVVNNFTDEKELQERARVYLAICERQASREARPRSFEDRLNAVTVTLNRGAFDEGLLQLRKLETEDPGHDYVQYLLSVAHAGVGNVAQALVHLRSSIELLPENRFRAVQDPDLEPLRQDAAFGEITEALPRRRKPAPAKKR